MQIDFTSYAIRQYEKEKKENNIFKLFIVQTSPVVELLKIATNNTNERQVCEYLDELKKEYGGLRGVLFYLLDELEADGFLPYITAQEIKDAIDRQGEDFKKKLTQTEEEQKAELIKGLEDSFKKMLITATEKQKNGQQNGQNSKSEQE